ncbi:hypothetical protein [Magnetospira sp. QH-2]|uniref:hypothetical protein n=1 Tax=Magnetospira sp. (strain QH-2) TaxID=1288970 RepID=UPI0003E815BE|nr:hypothetical protein [Magnetospira sp. QH-2]CCQ72490.1 protein of unknown function [Magnetospira sp. QH-2]
MSAKEFEALPDEGTIDPLRLRTMQSDIKREFNTRDRKPLENTIDDIRNGQNIPPVRIAEINGQTFTLDHRRVVAYRIAGKAIPYRKATQQEVRIALKKQRKMPTRDDGITIKVKRR